MRQGRQESGQAGAARQMLRRAQKIAMPALNRMDKLIARRADWAVVG